MKKLEDMVRLMTAKQIIMAMVEGLRNPVTRIDMMTYGRNDNGICFGCAATNAICKIQNINFPEFSEDDSISRAQIFNSDSEFIDLFETCINDLRLGAVNAYNHYATRLGIAQITYAEPSQKLPILRNDYSEEELGHYVRLAEAQPE